jgi:hypothetical protein
MSIEREWNGDECIAERPYSRVRIVPVYWAWEYFYNNPDKKPLCCFYAGLKVENLEERYRWPKSTLQN